MAKRMGTKWQIMMDKTLCTPKLEATRTPLVNIHSCVPEESSVPASDVRRVAVN